MEHTLEFTCPLQNGLHARPATMLAEAAGRYELALKLVNLRTDATANPSSVLDLVAAGVMHGDTCRLVATGPDAEAVCTELVNFITTELPRHDEPPAQPDDTIRSQLPRVLEGTEASVLTGIPTSPGIGRGMVFRLHSLQLEDLPEDTVPTDPQTELEYIRAAFEAVSARLEGDLGKAGSNVAADITQALLSIVKDPGFLGSVTDHVTNQSTSAARAVAMAVSDYSTRMRSSGSQYLIERITDLEELGFNLLDQLPGENPVNREIKLSEPSILVAADLSAGRLLALDRSLLSGIVLESAGTTSHAAILARSFGIPCVSGLEITGIPAGVREAVIDGAKGLLLHPVTEDVERYAAREARLNQRLSIESDHGVHQLTQTLDGRRIQIGANIATADEVEAALANGAEGVGLFRTELLFSALDKEPSEDYQFNVFKQVAEGMDGLPVIIRTLDIGGDKPLPYLNLPQEANPFLGLRGIRLYHRFPELFRRHLRAIVRASHYGNVWVMAPMVSSAAEAAWFRQQVNAVQQELADQDQEFNRELPVGIMIEVPSAAETMRSMKNHVDFFSVGTNDLTQYLLAVDRGNPSVADLYQDLHPALVLKLRQIAETAHTLGKWVGICGELARNPHYTGLLVGLGFDEFSMSAPAIPAIRETITNLHLNDCQALVDEVDSCTSAEEIENLLKTSRSATNLPISDADLYAVDVDCRTKAEAIRELCIMNYCGRRCRDVDELESAVWAREATYSTGLGHGIAIPHCKSEAVTSGSLAAIKLKQPIDWGSIDDQPVDIVIMLTMPKNDPGNTHLKVFAKLARKLMHEDFRIGLREAFEPRDVFAFLIDELDLHEEQGTNYA